jgi:hypothetical protein
MAWEKLRTDYTDAIFTGLRRYTPIDNGDGTTSFEDVTVYSNKENSFFGAKDANQINNAVNSVMEQIAHAYDEVTLTASGWTGSNGRYTQRVILSGVTASESIDLRPDDTVITQLSNDGVTALYIENNEGVLTAVSVGQVPTADLTIQVARVGVISLD